MSTKQPPRRDYPRLSPYLCVHNASDAIGFYTSVGVLSPRSIGGSPVTISLYVDDVDTTFAAAIAAATPVEDVSPEEIERRAAELFGS